MRLEEAEVDFLFLCEGANVKFVSMYVESLFDADQRFNGRVVKFSYTGENSNHELTAFIAFDESEAWSLFTARMGLTERLDYVDKAVFEVLRSRDSPARINLNEIYNSNFEYTYRLFKEENYGYLMVNAGGTIAYQLNLDKNLIKSPDVWKPGEW